MVDAEGTERRPRRFRSVAEKGQIVELTLAPGASVALVAHEHGVNANQVFKWRRAFDRGELVEPATVSTALLPVTVSAPCKVAMRKPSAQPHPATSGSIRIEFPSGATISAECGADPVLLRSILESLHKRSSSAPERGYGSPPA